MRTKKLIPIVSLILILTLVTLSISSAQGLPGGGWWTTIIVQNVDNKSGTLALNAYALPGSGKSDTSIPQPTGCSFDAGELLLFNPGYATDCSKSRIEFSVEDGFAGSASVSSDVDIRAVVQVGNSPLGSVGVTDGAAQAFYRGTIGQKAGDEIYFVPMKNDYFGQTTHHYVMAVGGDVTVDISATYHNVDYSQEGSKSKTGVSIQENRMYVIAPDDLGVPTGMIGAITVKVTGGSGKLAGATIEHPTTVSGNAAKFALATSALTPEDKDTTLFAPVFKKKFYADAMTGMTILNTGDVQATVSITFTVANVRSGSDAESAGLVQGDWFAIRNLAIDAKKDKTISAYNINRTDLGWSLVSNKGLTQMPDGVLASVKIVSDQPLVGVMNETNATFMVNGKASGKAAYTLFAASQATKKVSIPMAKEDFYAKTTGVTVVSIGASTTITITYRGGKGTGTLVANLGPDESITAYRCTVGGGGQCTRFDATKSTFLNNSGLNGDKYGVIVESSDAPIVVLAQESAYLNKDKDLANYEGFNLTP